MSLPRRQTPSYARVWSSPRPTGVLLLISILGGSAAAQVMMSWFGLPALHDELVLSTIGVENQEYWRFATYQMLQASWVQFLSTALVLYFAGREVEPIVGRGQVVSLFLGANIVGGILGWIVKPEAALYGASAGTAAVLTAYATILPELEHRTRLFGLVPLRFHTRHAVMLVLLFAGWCTIFGHCEAIGPAGILFGAALGWMWARALGFGRILWLQRMTSERERLARRRERMSTEELIGEEIDPILEKISRSGLRSLSRAERKLLDYARQRIAETTPRAH